MSQFYFPFLFTCKKCKNGFIICVIVSEHEQWTCLAELSLIGCFHHSCHWRQKSRRAGYALNFNTRELRNAQGQEDQYRPVSFINVQLPDCFPVLHQSGMLASNKLLQGSPGSCLRQLLSHPVWLACSYLPKWAKIKNSLSLILTL